MANLIERHAEKIVGVLSCFDRLVLQGTLPSVAYPQAMTTELDRRGIRLFDYAKQFALPFREAIRAHRARGRRGRRGDRVRPAHEELSEGRSPNLSKEREHRYRGFTLFDDDDQRLFEILCRGEFLIHGFRNRSLRQHLKQFRASQISRLLKRLRLHGIIKKVGNTYKYYLTQLGRHVAIAGLTLKNMFLVPEFANAAIAY